MGARADLYHTISKNMTASRINPMRRYLHFVVDLRLLLGFLVRVR